MFEVTKRGDVFVSARIYDWLVTAGTLGVLPRSYARAASKVADQQSQRVLDVGTGTGVMAIALKKHAPRAEVHGIDPSERMLDLARTKGVRSGVVVHFSHGWAQDLPFPDNEFDAVTFASVLHHIPAAQRGAALSEARRVLRPGAGALIVELVPTRFAGWLPSHRYQMDLEGCRRLLRATGFTDVDAGRLTPALLGYAVGRCPPPQGRLRPW